MPVTILTVNNLSKSFGVESIFSNISFQVREQERIALVGINGAGKSTLLNILAGHEPADSGAIDFRDGLRVTYQAQEATFAPDQTVWEAGLAAFAETLHLRERMSEMEQAMATADGDELDLLFSEYAELSTRFETAGGYDIDHQVASVLEGLGFSDEDRDAPAGTLSGGQRTRLALAQALLSDPDLLLLDEPTNHLDLKALDWIDGFLRSWRRALVVVSHDRYFLDRVTERTLDLSFGTLEDYPGGYSRYVELREERRARRQFEYEAQQEFINQTEEFIRRYKAGQRSKEARGRETRLARLERIEAPREHQVLKVRLQTAARSGRAVLTTTPLVVGYPGADSQSEPAVLATSPEMEVERGDRVAIIGPNGTGKTTLVRTIIGELSPLKGRLQFGVNVKPAYYAQGHEQLNPEDTVLSTLLKQRAWGEEAARTVAGRYLFSGDDVYKPVEALSGGERSRLALALLALEEANFLILDEPTNHLDISSRESLEVVLSEFDGTILFVSHDRYLIDRLATNLWVLEDGVITPRLGNYSDYLRSRSGEPEPKGKSEQGAKKGAGSSKAPEPVPPNRGRDNGRRSDRELRKLRQELAAAERSIGKLEQRMNEISDDLAVANVDRNIEAIARLGQEYDEVQQRLEESYRDWESLSSEIYEADAQDVRVGAEAHD